MTTPQEHSASNVDPHGKSPDPGKMKFSVEATGTPASRDKRTRPDDGLEPDESLPLDDGLGPDWAAYGEKAGAVAGIEPGTEFWSEGGFRSKLDTIGSAGTGTRALAGRATLGFRTATKKIITGANRAAQTTGDPVPDDGDPVSFDSPIAVKRILPALSSNAAARRVQQGSMVVVAVAGLLLAGILVTPDETRLETSVESVTTTEAAAGSSVDPLSLRSNRSDPADEADENSDDGAEGAGGIGTTTSEPSTTAADDDTTTSDTEAETSTSGETPSSEETSTSADPAPTSASTSSTARPTTASTRPTTGSTGRATTTTRPTTASTVSTRRTTTTRPTTSTSRTPISRPTTTTTEATTSTSESTTSTTEPTTSTTEPTTTTTESTTTTTEPTTTTTEPTTTSSTPCSSPTWNLVLDEQFNGSSIDGSRWQVYNGTGNAGHGRRQSSAMSVSGGLLTITASMDNGTLVSGGMEHRVDQTYGRYEFRVRTDQDPSESMSGVVMTWPQSDVHPRDGENNIYETLATPGDRHEFYSFIHKPYGSVSDQDYTVHSANASSWHTMAMEWTPDSVKLFRDGVLVKTIDETSSNLIPDVAHHATIQLDAWSDSLPANVQMQVDYIKVFSFQGC